MKCEILKTKLSKQEAFVEIVEIVRRLRAPGGCPWDRKQTPETLKQYIIEEAYEVLEAIDEKNPSSLLEELGDLMLQVFLQSEIAEEQGLFSIAEVMKTLSNKLVNRHPHVFGEKKVKDADEVISNWEKIKQSEKNGRGLLAGLPPHLPALQTAARIGEKASRIGFDWPNADSVRKKITEELAEADEADLQGNTTALAEEIGDLLFSVAQWARHHNIEPEEALRNTCSKFKKRFAVMEKTAQEDGTSLEKSNSERLERLWEEAKEKLGGVR